MHSDSNLLFQTQLGDGNYLRDVGILFVCRGNADTLLVSPLPVINKTLEQNSVFLSVFSGSVMPNEGNIMRLHVFGNNHASY